MMTITIDDLDAIGMGPPCPDCGSATDWLPCWNGCSDGYFTYEEHLQYEDPLWYDPDDEKPCDACNTQGGWWRCWYCEKCFNPRKLKQEPEL